MYAYKYIYIYIHIYQHFTSLRGLPRSWGLQAELTCAVCQSTVRDNHCVYRFQMEIVCRKPFIKQNTFSVPLFAGAIYSRIRSLSPKLLLSHFRSACNSSWWSLIYKSPAKQFEMYESLSGKSSNPNQLTHCARYFRWKVVISKVLPFLFCYTPENQRLGP